MVIRIIWIPVSDHLFPEVKEKTLGLLKEQLEKNPQMSDEGADSFVGLMKKFWGVATVFSIIVSTLFYGAIFSLIGGAVARKKTMPPGADNF